jgi:predicted alpha/beta-fold hydrolase
MAGNSLQTSVIVESKYRHVPYLTNGHLETIVPSAFRKVKGVLYQRQRLELADGDFVDLDWLRHADVVTKKLVIISHGLEGSSDRHYSRGMSKYFYEHGWDALAWNCRSCSGELNRLPRFYHHGDTGDLQDVIDEAFRKEYDHVVLVGFSMGGSFSMKYLGEKGLNVDARIKGGVGFSVPCSLDSSAAELDKPSKSFYRDRFLRKLGKKILAKSFIYPDKISYAGYGNIKTFKQFDDTYTAPLHGFRDAADFYSKSSCDQYLKSISVPALIVNAANDPFLTPECYPGDLTNVYLEIPKRGGHVGFSLLNSEENYMERRAYEFLS